ncbi:glycoside hydrolase family 3 C-terminal domain-containing protein [Maribacter sp. TH_r10]|uniref:beta-glucosidase family protein n=1 Tax=Maribacter sp. TH_r10 TaxID=3082086 RepID=UPI002953EC1D|nr:glycoside hydrolase family 3 C-terminal domain-containing protein [Maribacter sp. TH_r10]MDV7138389.1 glycoside hydrolase family 3 C-terminal domain-containing protein [Maribacter sp. TH_r10]
MNIKIAYSNTWKKVLIILFVFTKTVDVFAQKTNSTLEKSIESKIDSIIPLLTLKEKVDMCHAQSKFSTKGVGRLGIPELWMSDGPHGVRAEISWDSWDYAGWTNDSITAFPALTCLAATFNPKLSGDYGYNLGEEARYREKDILLGPGVNIYRTPLNGRNFEYMGEDPFLASKMVVPYIKGVQKNNVAACAKHFALNNQEHWRNTVNVEVGDRALYEIYLPAFKAAVQEAGVWAVMGAYNKFRGQYATHNELLTKKILKGDWDYDGVVISDWSSTHDTMEAAMNGLDLEMGTGTDGLGTNSLNHYDNYYLASPFLKALKSGEIDETVLNDKVRRILRLMFRTTLKSNRGFGKINNKEHHAVARKVAQEGIVLLKNENSFFPIEDKEGITIAVIGENATRSMTAGGGSSELKPQFEISPLEGLKARYENVNIVHSMGYATGPSVYDAVIPSKLNADSLRIEAVKIAKNADIVLFFGGLNKSHLQDCEGADRTQFNLPFGQDELLNDILEVNKNVGYILMSGNAVEIPWLRNIDGLIQTWYLGSMAGYGIADIISGDVNPSGKLPFTFPAKLEDNAAHSFGVSSYPGIDQEQNYKEGILVGYRWHDTKKITPLYAFGYGLSYTSFNINNVKTDKKTYLPNDKIKVTCQVTNSGNLDGAEVVQVYVGKPKSKVKRALKELKGFEKINLKKGTSKTVEVSIDASDLAFYDESISDWNLEKGDYVVYVGNASNNIIKTIKINIK